MKVLKTIVITLIILTLTGGYYLKYRIDDSKIVKVISVEAKIEQKNKFQYAEFRYIYRDGKPDSKYILAKFEQPLSKIAAKNGCVKLKLNFSDWYPWDKYRGLDDFEEVACPF
jgi:hypothetical protein